MARTLTEIIEDAKKEFLDYLHENEDMRHSRNFFPSDQAHEIADSSVPIYTADLARLAADYLELFTNEPEIGPAFDGRPTPSNIVAANIYEEVYKALMDVLQEWEDNEPEDE